MTYEDLDAEATKLYCKIPELFQASVIIGFTMDGKRMQINHFTNPMQRDALESFLKDALRDFTKATPVEVVPQATK